MIVSASYRTDIPSFYSPWFERRYRAGFCLVADPFGKGLRYVALRAPEVAGYVFWTRNVAPFIGALYRLQTDGLPFVVQYSITGYSRALEERTPLATRAIALCHELRERFGPHAVVWRYDPIVITDLTPAAYHRDHFRLLCGQIEGATDEVVVSFAQMYRKTVSNLKKAGQANGFTHEDPPANWKAEFLLELSAVAAEHGLRLAVCAQRALLRAGLQDAACVDPARLSRVAGRELLVPKHAHRSACGCFQSVDIGAYDTCPMGCVYCYAVRFRAAAERRHREHDPADLMLWRPDRFRRQTHQQLLAQATGREEPDLDQMALFEYEE